MGHDLIIPKVSIIMPAYNAANYIKESINSVLDQTFKDWELIIIDDGSLDNTAKMVKGFFENPRIRYYYQENGKQGKARNLGISKSRGKYLAFLDADDVWLPEKLEFQVIEIEEKNVDLIFSDSYIFSNSEVNKLSKKMNIQGSCFYDKNAIELFLQGNRIPILTVLVKKEKVIAVGGFSEKLDIQNVEDYHLWLKLLMSNNIFYSSNQVLAKYREHNNSATSSDKLVLDKVPNVFFDLFQHFPNYRELIKKELKIKFNLIYKKNIFTKLELGIWIKKNTKYLSKEKISFMYLFFNLLLPTKVTKRLLIYWLNS